jgi:ABC-type polysaccharide/polyol phosphate transport system ATPase subunit
MNENIQIQLRNITKQYHLYNTGSGRLFNELVPFLNRKFQKFTALDNINLDVAKGEIVGIIGRNGSGKSTLLRVVAGITAPTTGSVVVNGKIVPLFELGIGFHGDLTGRENLYYFTILQNFGKQKSAEIIEKAVEFAELGDFIDQPIRTYSRGMRSRLAFSISIFIDADILAIDEVLAVGDAAFKEKSFQKFNELITSGKTILLVTHSEKEVEKVCNRCILMGSSKIILDGKPGEVVKEYKEMNRALAKGQKVLERL